MVPVRRLGLIVSTLVATALSCSTGRDPALRKIAEIPEDLLRARAMILRAEDRRVVDDGVISAVAGADAELRARGVRALGRIGDASRRPLVEQALADTDSRVRAAAAFSLGLLRPPEALPALIRARADASPIVRAHVAAALGLLRGPSSASALEEMLDDTHADVVAAACYAMEDRSMGKETADRLINLAASAEPRVVLAASHTLAALASRTKARDPVARRNARAYLSGLAESRSPDIRLLAARALDLPASIEEVETLGRLVADPDVRVTANALRSLSFPGAPIDPFIRQALEHEDDRVVLAAVLAIGRTKGTVAVDALAKLIVFDERPWVRELATISLRRVDPDLAAATANGISKDEDPRIRRAAAALVTGRKDPPSLEIAQRLADDDDLTVRRAAIPALAGEEGPLMELLAAVIDDPDPGIRAAVARAAGVRMADRGDRDKDREDALAVLEAIWAGETDAHWIHGEVLAALDKGRTMPGMRPLLERGLACPGHDVRLMANEMLRERFSVDHGALAGAAVERPLEHYMEILRWADRPRAARVVVQRAGFDPGRFVVTLDTDSTPLTAWNFSQLAESGFFSGLPVHRVVPNLLVQSGRPKGDASGGPGYTIRDELTANLFSPGTLAMASFGPDTGGSQWFVTLTSQPQMIGAYTAFGRVARNFEGTVTRLLPDDVVIAVEVYEGDGSEELPPIPGPS